MRQMLILDTEDLNTLLTGNPLEIITPAGPVLVSIDTSAFKKYKTGKNGKVPAKAGTTCRFCHRTGFKNVHARQMHEVKTHGWRKDKKDA